MYYLREKNENVIKRTNDVPIKVEEVMSFCIKLLKMFGLSPIGDRNPVIAHVHNVLVVFFMLMSFSLQIVAVVICWGDLKPIAYTIGLTSGCGAILINYIFFIYNRNRIFEVIRILKTDYVSKVKPKYLIIVKSSEKQVIRSAIFKLLIGSAMLCLGSSVPLINKHSAEASGFDVSANLTKYEYMMKYMMFMTYTPLEIRQSPQFEINYLFMFVLTTAVVGPDVVIDSLYYALLSHLTAQYKILIALLDDIYDNIRDKKKLDGELSPEDLKVVEDNDGASVDDSRLDPYLDETKKLGTHQDVFEDYLVEFIQKHQDLLSFSEKVLNLMSGAAFFQVVSTPIMICTGGFLMSLSVAQNVLMDMIKFSTVVALGFYKLLIYCLYAQDLTQASEAVKDAIYSTKWYEMSPAFKRLVPMIIRRCDKAVVPKAGRFYVLSMESFRTVLNSSYSYFTLLLQLNESSR